MVREKLIKSDKIKHLVSRGKVREVLNLITLVSIMCGKHSRDQ